MGFKLPGKSMTSGTSAHSSALKLREKELASALKQKPYVKPGGKATGKMKDYPIGSKERYQEYEARGWAHDDTTKGGEPAPASEPVKTDVEKKGDEQKAKVDIKTGTKLMGVEAREGLRDTRSREQTRYEKALGKGERKKARIDVRTARKEYGRGSEEVKAAKEERKYTRKSTRKIVKGARKARRADILEEKSGILSSKASAAEYAGKTKKAERLAKRSDRKEKKRQKRKEQAGYARVDRGQY